MSRGKLRFAVLSALIFGAACSGTTLPLEGGLDASGASGGTRAGTTGETGGGGTTAAGGVPSSGGTRSFGGTTAGSDEGITRAECPANSAAFPFGAAPAGALSVVQILGEPYGSLVGPVTFVGDLDGDGLDEFTFLGQSQGNVFKLFLFYGRTEFPQTLDMTDADLTLTNANGIAARLGDIDGDGLDDFAFTDTGSLHLIYGSAERVTGTHAASELGPTWSPLNLTLVLNARGLGDIDGDGLADFVVDAGDPRRIGDELGPDAVGSMLFYGRSDRSAQLGAVADATFTGTSGTERVTYGAAAAGDLDGDGYADLLISTEHLNPSIGYGTTALFYGRPGRFAGTLSPGDADATFDRRPNWYSFSGLGDLNADGYDDLGLTLMEPGGYVGADVLVSYGGAKRFSGFNNSCAADFSLSVSNEIDVVSAGDVNGDGLPDIVVGAPAEDPGGALALLLGSPGRHTGDWSIPSANLVMRGELRTVTEPPSNEPQGVYDWLGRAAAANGDANGDGFADILVTAPGNYFGDAQGGYAYLVLGAAF